MIIYIRTRGGPLSKTFSFRYAASCDLEFGNATGVIRTPGFDLADYPRNLACSWRIKPRLARPFTVTGRLVLQPTDLLQIFEIDSTASQSLLTNQNFTGSSFGLHVQSGDALIKLLSGPVGASSAFVVSYSVDCPALTAGDLVLLSTPSRVVGAQVTVSCPEGYELSSQAASFTMKCLSGGVWSESRVPQCQPRYCGPAPRFANAVPVNVSAFTYLGVIEYRCLDGFVLESDTPVGSVTCTAEGNWTVLANCLPKRCPELLLQSVSVSHLLGKVMVGTNYEFG